MNPFFRKLCRWQHNVTQHDTERIRLRSWHLITLMLFSFVLIAKPDAAAPYTIRMCATPVDLVLRGVPEDDSSIGIFCAKPASAQPSRYPVIVSSAKDPHLKTPVIWAHLIVDAHGDRLDVRLQGEKTTRYEARRVPFDARSVELHSDLPGNALQPTISTHRLHDDHYVTIDVTEVRSARVVHDLVRLGNLNVRGLGNITDARISLRFSVVNVLSVLQLLAYTSSNEGTNPWLIVQHDNRDRYVIGRNRNLSSIDTLLDKLALSEGSRRKAILEQIIKLAKPSTPGDLAVPVAEQLKDLADMAFADRDYARAITLDRARLSELGGRYHGDDSADYGIALADLADAQLKQHDFKDTDAPSALLRAVAIMQRHPGDDTLQRIVGAYGYLAIAAVKVEQPDKAVAFNAKAWAALNGPEAKQLSDVALGSASIIVGVSYMQLGLYFNDRHEDAKAQLPFERALLLQQRFFGEDGLPTDMIREMVTINAEKQHNYSRAATYYSQQIAVSGKRKNPIDYHYVNALSRLSYIRATQKRYAEAVALWRKDEDVRRRLLGDNAPQVVAALRAEQLLYQLADRMDKAQALSLRIAAMRAAEPDPAVVKKIDARLRRDLEHTISMALWNYYYERIERASKLKNAAPDALALDYEHLADCELAIHADQPRLAIRDLRKALDIRLRHQGEKAPETRRVAQQLIALYRRAGQPDQAGRLRRLMQLH